MSRRKDDRRAAAQERQAAYDALTIDQKIAVAQSRRGESKRELSRLMKLAEKQEAA
jgi:hypothetical protein